MKTTILLVRHGQSEANLADLFAGHTGHPLTALGHQQAEKTAQYLRETYPVNMVFSSDLPRAFQTAEHIANIFSLPVITDARFREISGGEWEYVPLAKLSEKFPEDYHIWKTDIGNACCTGGEKVLDTAERVFDGLKALAQRYAGGCIVVATHAMALRTALWKVSEGPMSSMQQISLGSNCSVSELIFEQGELSLGRINFAEHLIGCETKLPSEA